eukprot:TRINITY_DN10208_c0_g2_i1.p1 TRINITY_DN10208_c0_g2~~TRINITY_DN10208_c0_g2_i1.p1  ORF type:complete len:414 (-),score=99.53 TRINITY_DN10208_c0_g2_i1:13-1254(-)
MRAYIDEQVKSLKASAPATAIGMPAVAVQDQAQQFDEMRAALEQRIDSSIQEVRFYVSEEIRAFASAFTKEIDQKLAQAEVQAKDGAIAATQAIVNHQSIDHVLASDVSRMETEFAAFRQHHDDHAARVQEVNNDHSALFERMDKDNELFRKNYDSHVSSLRDVEARCAKLVLAFQSQQYTAPQALDVPPNVATKEWVEMCFQKVDSRVEHVEKRVEQAERLHEAERLNEEEEKGGNHTGPRDLVNTDLVSADFSGRKGSFDKLKDKSASVIDSLAKLAELEHSDRRELATGPLDEVVDVAAIRKLEKTSDSLSLRIEALLSHVTPPTDPNNPTCGGTDLALSMDDWAMASQDSYSAKVRGLQGRAEDLTDRMKMVGNEKADVKDLLDSKFSALSDKVTYFKNSLATLEQAML